MFAKVFLTLFGLVCCHSHRSSQLSKYQRILHVLCMTPKTCLPFMFILFSLPSPLCPRVSLLHENSSTHPLIYTLRCVPPSLPPNNHCLTHRAPSLTDHGSRTAKHAYVFTAQPLRVVTEDTCLFHYLVPAPMSPSNKSVGSDAGSQDSGDGNAGPRCVCV